MRIENQFKGLLNRGPARFLDLRAGLRLVLFSLLCAPILALLIFAISTSFDKGVAFLVTPALRAFLITAELMLGVGCVAGFLGLITAYAVSYYDFWGRKWLAWALVLPLALPTYIAAYSWLELFEFTGPIQSLIRDLTGAQTIKDYWFVDLRSYWGAVFVLSLVLYPYIYLACRTLFSFQSGHQIEAARALNGSGTQIFFRIALPFVRPALIVGISLAMMELLNDVGAVEAFGQQTLSLTILSTWLNQSSLGGATQIAVSLLLLIALILWVERLARANQPIKRQGTTSHSLQRRKLGKLAAILVGVGCSLIVLCGFLVPILFLSYESIRHFDLDQIPRFIDATLQTFSLSFLAAVGTLLVGLVTSFTLLRDQRRWMRLSARPVTFGYALPGTVLAIGLLMVLGPLDGWINDRLENWGFERWGLIFSGSTFILVIAYIMRFSALAHGNLEGSLLRRGHAFHDAGRSLGAGFWRSFFQLDLPVLKPALISAGLIVFIETVKELPATLMLRSFGIETLPVIIFEQASLEAFEVAALPALVLALLSTISVYLLMRLSPNPV